MHWRGYERPCAGAAAGACPCAGASASLPCSLRLSVPGGALAATALQVLAAFVDDDLTQAEVAQHLGLAQQRIAQLLLYNRFNTTAGCIKIPEFRFRQYWKQMANFKSLRGGKLPRDPERAAQADRLPPTQAAHADALASTRWPAGPRTRGTPLRGPRARSRGLPPASTCRTPGAADGAWGWRAGHASPCHHTGASWCTAYGTADPFVLVRSPTSLGELPLQADACMPPGERRAGPADPDDRCPPSTEAAQRRSPTRTLSLLLAYSHRGYVPALRTGAARAPEGRGRVLAARCSVASPLWWCAVLPVCGRP